MGIWQGQSVILGKRGAENKDRCEGLCVCVCEFILACS